MAEGTAPADPSTTSTTTTDPVAAWAASGAMALTGHADGPPLSPAAAVVPALEALARHFAHLAAAVRPVTAGQARRWQGRTSGGGRPIWDVTSAVEEEHAASGETWPAWQARHVEGQGTSDAARLADDAGSEVDVGELLSGRAGLLGLRRQGRVSANGSCRLLSTADGWAAVNLARPSDVEAVGALVERVVDGDPWTVLARRAERMSGADLVERAALLAVPAAMVPARLVVAPPDPGRPARTGVPRPQAAATGPGPPPTDSVREPAGAWASGTLLGGSGAPFALRQVGAAHEAGRGGPAPEPLTVVDLSAMWAGPLCARLLGRAGLRVVKVESSRRPDGARTGDARFFDWLHGGHASVALDAGTSGGRAALARLIAAADVVIESSRPRALAQLGIDAEAVVAARPGVTWVSITGYGREGAEGQRVAFGDDAAAAAGLVAHDDQGGPVFCGDAIADPITGLSAAVGALTSIVAGGGHLVDVPMVAAVAATTAVPAAPATAHRSSGGAWHVATATGVHPVAGPSPLRPTEAPARPLGADTTTVLDVLGVHQPASMPPT